jgi:M6 family metalloprotease-like protein
MRRACLLTFLFLTAACDDGATAPDPVIDAALDRAVTDAAVDAAPDRSLLDARPVDARAPDALVDAAPMPDASPDARPADAAIDMGPPGIDPVACQLPFNGGQAVGVGFPRPAVRLHSTGVVRAAVVFVDFPDVAADRTPEAAFARISPGAEAFFAATSYGRLELVLDPHLEWLRLSRNAPHYAEGLTSFEGHRAFIEEAVEAADPGFDFSAADLVVVIAAPNAAAIPYGPTWMGIRGWEIEADGNAMTNGITSGHDLLFWSSQWLNHEMGHSMSLPDLYQFGGPGGFTRPFSLMDLIDSDAPEFLAWERWQLGWIDDDQVRCAAYDAPIRLTPISTAGGPKAAMVPLGDDRVLVAESRRAIGYDAGLGRTGVVVTLIDGGIPTGQGPIRVLNDGVALQPGAELVVEDVVIEVLDADAQGDTIRLSR